MALVRFQGNPALSPWREFDVLANRLNRVFDSPASNGGGWAPAMNVEETPENLILTAELPGLREDNIDIELENGVLTISGEKVDTRSSEGEERRYHVWERSYGSFQRSFTLPRTIDSTAIEAEFVDGVLTIRMPKAAEAKSRKIELSAKS